MKWLSNESYQDMAGILLELNQQLQSSLEKKLQWATKKKAQLYSRNEDARVTSKP